jgi:hypothetical protein
MAGMYAPGASVSDTLRPHERMFPGVRNRHPVSTTYPGARLPRGRLTTSLLRQARSSVMIIGESTPGRAQHAAAVTASQLRWGVMPANRMNRDEFYTAMAPSDDARIRKILWTLYWRAPASFTLPRVPAGRHHPAGMIADAPDGGELDSHSSEARRRHLRCRTWRVSLLRAMPADAWPARAARAVPGAARPRLHEPRGRIRLYRMNTRSSPSRTLGFAGAPGKRRPPW